MLHRNKFEKKITILNYLIDDGKIIKDKPKMTEQFTNFFIYIGPNMVENMVNENNKHYNQYLTNQYDWSIDVD